MKTPRYNKGARLWEAEFDDGKICFHCLSVLEARSGSTASPSYLVREHTRTPRWVNEHRIGHNKETAMMALYKVLLIRRQACETELQSIKSKLKALDEALA